MDNKPIAMDLHSLTPREFVTRWFDERVPHLFGANRSDYLKWRCRLATVLGVSWLDVVLVGSAAAGHSLSPHKAFREFGPGSDVDVAVISRYHFDLAWRWMRGLGSDRYKLPLHVQKWVKEHEMRLVYWGTIATDQILQHLPFGADWVTKLARLSREAPIAGRMINVRLYRDHPSLEAYLLAGVRKLRDLRESTGSGGNQ